MSAQKGNVFLKLVVVLALLGGGVFAVLVGLRETAIVAEVRRGPAPDAVPGSVVVHADKDLQHLKIEGSGRVKECAALDPGALFKQGDELLTLDTSDLVRAWNEATREYNAQKAKIAAADQNSTKRAVAQKALDDATRLLKAGRASQEDVNAATRALAAVDNEIAVLKLTTEKLDADYDAAKKTHEIQLAKMKVVAPMDGMVEGVMVAEGTLVNPGATVATFYSNKRVVLAKISEEDYAKVKLGDPARVQLLSIPHQTFDAKVTKILPFADPETRRFTVYLDVQAELAQLTPYSTGEVTITVDQHDNVPLVPSRAISYGNIVYVVKNGRVEKRTIEVGFKGLIEVEVTKGLEPGELVIVENVYRFRHGQRVRVEPAK